MFQVSSCQSKASGLVLSVLTYHGNARPDVPFKVSILSSCTALPISDAVLIRVITPVSYIPSALQRKVAHVRSELVVWQLREFLRLFAWHVPRQQACPRFVTAMELHMNLLPLNSENHQGSNDMRNQPSSVRAFRLGTAVVCLMLSSLLCGCAAGLMSMPGAAMLADRFGGEKEPKETEDKDKDKDKDKKKSKSRLDDEDDDFGTSVKTPLLSAHMSVQGNTVITLRGVGLVTGLNRTEVIHRLQHYARSFRTK